MEVGIGAALADAFAEHGPDLILVARNRGQVEAEAETKQFGVQGTCLSAMTDARPPARLSCENRGARARRQPRHNAGWNVRQVCETDLNAELKMIQLNVTSVVE